MALLAWPLRFLWKGLGVLFVLFLLALVGTAAYAIYNHLQPASQAAVENLSKGVVEVQSRGAWGTGTIVRSGDTWRVVTAAHVVTDDQGVDANVLIVSEDGSTQEAPVQSVDMDRDLAVIAVEPSSSWKAFPIQGSFPRPGDKVLARCFFDSQVREGIYMGPADVMDIQIGDLLESLGRFRPAVGHTLLSYLESEAGCSGGPLVNRGGELIGIVLAGNGITAVATALATSIIDER